LIKRNLLSTTTSTTPSNPTAAELKQKADKSIDQVQKTVSETKAKVESITDDGKKAVAVIQGAEKTLSQTLDSVKTTLSGFSGNTYVVSAASSLNIRAGPGTSYNKVGIAKKGDKFTVSEQSNGFGKIGSGKWVSMRYLTKDGSQTNPSDAKSAVKNAKSVVENAMNSLKSLFASFK